MRVLGSVGKTKKKKPRWDKTDHSFLPKYILTRYRRNVGDVLIEKNYVDIIALNNALNLSKKQGVRIGDVLLEHGAVTEEHLLEAVAQVQRRIYVKDISVYPGLDGEFDTSLLNEHEVFPLFKHKDTYVFAITDTTKFNPFVKKCAINSDKYYYVYATKEHIFKALSLHNNTAPLEFGIIKKYLDSGAISLEQAVIALNYCDFRGSVLLYMGLSPAPENKSEIVLESPQ